MSISTDYGSYISSYGKTSSILGAFLVFYIILIVLSLAISAIMIVSQWRIFAKNNKPGWYALIPILNVWTLFEIVGIQGWWSLVPFANIVFNFIASYKLAIKMGRSQGFAVVTAIFPYVGYPMLAFAKDTSAADKTKQNVKKEENTNVATSTENIFNASSSESKFCAQCGAEVKNGNAFCSKCGSKIN